MIAKKTYPLKSSSLIEVLVSLTIISLVIGIATAAYIQLIHAEPKHILKRMKQLEEIAENSLREQHFEQEVFTLPDGTPVFQSVIPYQENTRLQVYELRTEAKMNEKALIFRKIIAQTDE